LALIDPTVAENVPPLNPAAIRRLAGTPIALFVLETVNRRPPAGAGPLSVTVQVEAPGALTGEGEQEMEVGATLGPTTGTMVSTPLDPLDGILVPSLVDETVPVNWSEVEASVAPVAIWMVACATTPSAIALEFKPNITQVILPLPFEQVTVFPAAVAAVPVVIVTLEMSVVE
jgi:hypothetical protein